SYRGQVLPAHYSSGDFRRMAPLMQMIFQDPYSSLNPRMTVGEIIAEGLRLKNKGNTKERVSQWLEKVGLSPSHASRYPHEFSGGQRQRIGIARALIMEPEFVVCDEPISALDVSVQAQVVNLLNELRQSMGLTLLFIAHDLSMVRYISDRMAVMYLGSIVELGNAHDVYFEPRHPYTQVLIASNPEPDPVSERQRLSTPIQGEIPSPVNVPAGCRFAGRCPKVTPVCRDKTPELSPLVSEDRLVACHLYSSRKIHYSPDFAVFEEQDCPMRDYFLRRLLLIPPTLIGVTIIVFVITRLVPGGPLERAIMEAQQMSVTSGTSMRAGDGMALSQAQLDRLRE